MEKIRLLLVEDERTLAGIICDTLNEKGFDVCVAYNGVTGYDLFEHTPIDVVVTDIMMPHMDGFTFVKKIRQRNKNIPILFLSARSGADDVVEGFETGGNDYLRKPFAMSELIVRVKALLGRASCGESEKPQAVFQLGRFVFDHPKCLLNQEILTAREADLLLALSSHLGEVVSAHDLLVELWGSDTYFNNRSLNVYISHLRQRLATDKSIAIINVRGVGYKLAITPPTSHTPADSPQ